MDSRYTSGQYLRNIYFTDKFKEDISRKEISIRINNFRLGEYYSSVPRGEKNPDGTHTGIEYLSYDYMKFYSVLPDGDKISDRISPSASEDGFNLDCIYTPETELLKMYLIPKNTNGVLDEGMYDDRYKVIYVMYTNVLTDVERLAFVIYNEDIEVNSPTLALDPLGLSKSNNLITIKIPIKCELLTHMDSDTKHLEGPGVSYMNYYSMPKGKYNSSYVSKESYERYYYNTISSDDPFIGGVTINKFGLKMY